MFTNVGLFTIDYFTNTRFNCISLEYAFPCYDVFQNTTLTIVGNFTSVYCSEMAWKWVYTEPVDLSALASNEEAKKKIRKKGLVESVFQAPENPKVKKQQIGYFGSNL